MIIDLTKLSKRNLTIFLNALNESNAKITHQRGKCDDHECSSCLNFGACGMLCEMAEEVMKELEKHNIY